ncbi:hypothetical protein M899_1563 [Bacteriovorax sp. BSW11_IV]|uniref:hypothetical protein n=1 Tax=Bacteriovorax sp. BSW11_IV TaxID=1353529 RepID=UPI00038A2CDD|nr:hypothetical protein [Bacteriovorax sp. BSW11_IV]EQC49297.1 hypothetical protein M899_1563 [Bacteriovorax sp. BSW11_IV]
MTKFLISILVLSFLSSCALIVEADKGQEDIVLKEKSKNDFMCDQNHKSQLLTQTNESDELLSKLKLKNKLTSTESFVVLVLAEMLYSPYIFSPDAKMQILEIEGDKRSHAFYNGESNLIWTLNDILKNDKKSRSLYALATLVEKSAPDRISISDRFSTFLQEYKDKLYQIPSYKKYYFRAGQILKENETIPKVNLASLVSKYLSKKVKPEVQHYLFDYKTDKDNYKCNFDLNIYDNSIYMVSDTTRVFRGQIGLQDGKKALYATISFTPQLDSDRSDFLFYSSKKVTPSGLCFNTNNNNVFMSSKGPDPGQLLHKHIVKMTNVHNEQDLERALTAPRFLILVPPKRLVLETKRTKIEELEYLQGLNMPIYHTDNIGNIWGSYDNRLFKDFRSRDQLKCSSL